MKQIQLTQGKAALVDDADYEMLMQWKWHYGKGYARRPSPGIQRRVLMMHREILNPPADKEVDHINRNKLDNQRSNLRLADHSQNVINNNPQYKFTPTSRYKGVKLHRPLYHLADGSLRQCQGEKSRRLVWEANITHRNKRHYIGKFETELEAALAYDRVARKLHGEFAYLNFP